MKYQIPRHAGLADARKLERGGHRFTFGYSDAQHKTLDVDDSGRELLRALRKPMSVREAARAVDQTEKQTSRALKELQRAGLAKPVEPRSPSMERYDRHLLFYDLQGLDSIEAQKRIGNTTVALIGMGGIGSWVSMGLIGSGFKELRLIDFDTIELSNLTRQILFTEADLGRSKVEVAAERLRERNSKTKIAPFPLQLSGTKELAKALRGVDFVILSADRPSSIHDWVDEVCAALAIPYLNVGYRDGMGIVGPLTKSGETSCYQCFKHQEKVGESDHRLIAEFEARYQAPSFGPLNALASSIAVMELMKWLTGFGETTSLGCELEIDPRTLSIKRTPYRRDPDCEQITCRR